MKLLFACILLVAALTSLESAPAPAKTIQLYKAGSVEVKDIWSDCSAPSDPAKIESITITPDPPQRGATLKLSAAVSLSEVVTGGQIEIKLKYGIFPAIDQKEDLCATLKQNGVVCPLQTGNQTLTLSQSVPSASPGGHYTGNAYVRDQNGKELVCIALDFHM